MKKFIIIMAMASVLPIAALVFGRCASADSTAQRETPARSTTAQENAGLAIRQVEIYPLVRIPFTGLTDTALRFSPDGKWLFGAGIYDAATGRELKRPYSTSIVAFSPDMRRYIQVSGSTFRIRNWETDEVIVTIQNTTDRVNPVFSPDGRHVAVLTGDGKNIKILDASNGQEIMIVEGWEGGIDRFGYSADGRNMVLANSENIKVFDLVNRQQLRTFSVIVTSIDFRIAIISPNGRYYIVRNTGPDRKGYIKIYDTDSGRELRVLSGHGDPVSALACSPDGRTLISTDTGKIMKVWDMATGRELRSTELDDYGINNAAYSADNRRIVFRTSRGITVLDAGNYRELLVIKFPSLPRLSQSPNGRYIAAEVNGTIKIWDLENGRLLRSLSRGSQGNVGNLWTGGLDWTNDGKRLTYGYKEGERSFSIRTVDIETGRQISSVPNNRFIGINDLTYSPDGSRMIEATGFSIDLWDIANSRVLFSELREPREYALPQSIYLTDVLWRPNSGQVLVRYIYNADFDNPNHKIIDIQNGNVLRTITQDMGRIVSYSPDGRRILSYSDNAVRQWDAETLRQLQVSIRHEKVGAAQYSPNGRQIATSGREDEYVRAWNAENGSMLWERRVYSHSGSISYSADGKKIIVVLFFSNSVYILDSATGEVVFSQRERSAFLSPDGKWLITASHDGSVRILSAETFIEKARLIAFDDNEWLAITPDGYYIASARGDQYINARVGNTVTGIDRYRSTFNKPAIVQARLSNSGRMTGHREGITSVAVNPAGTRLATVSLDKTIKIWDLESGRELRGITGIGGYVNAISWSPDGRTLIHGAEDRTVRIWDAETGRTVRTINGHSDYVNEARHSPDGRRIASVADDKLIKIWDAETGREIRTLTGHTDMVGVVAWSPDGRRIASGTIEEEKTIRIWDAESGRLLQTIPNQGGRIMALVYSPDGRKIASCTTEEPMVKIWNAENGALIKNIPIENRRPYSLAWNSDNKQLAVGYTNENAGYIGIFNTDTGTRIRQLFPSGLPYSISWTPDYRRIVAACNFSDGQFIRVYDALSGNEL